MSAEQHVRRVEVVTKHTPRRSTSPAVVVCSCGHRTDVTTTVTAEQTVTEPCPRRAQGLSHVVTFVEPARDTVRCSCGWEASSVVFEPLGPAAMHLADAGVEHRLRTEPIPSADRFCFSIVCSCGFTTEKRYTMDEAARTLKRPCPLSVDPRVVAMPMSEVVTLPPSRRVPGVELHCSCGWRSARLLRGHTDTPRTLEAMETGHATECAELHRTITQVDSADTILTNLVPVPADRRPSRRDPLRRLRGPGFGPRKVSEGVTEIRSSGLDDGGLVTSLIDTAALFRRSFEVFRDQQIAELQTEATELKGLARVLAEPGPRYNCSCGHDFAVTDLSDYDTPCPNCGRSTMDWRTRQMEGPREPEPNPLSDRQRVDFDTAQEVTYQAGSAGVRGRAVHDAFRDNGGRITQRDVDLLRAANPGPGPIERRLTSRIRHRLTGRWSPEVIEERLRRHEIFVERASAQQRHERKAQAMDSEVRRRLNAQRLDGASGAEVFRRLRPVIERTVKRPVYVTDLGEDDFDGALLEVLRELGEPTGAYELNMALTLDPTAVTWVYQGLHRLSLCGAVERFVPGPMKSAHYRIA